MSEYWSQYHLELYKADLPIDEFKYEVFRNIGVITEACLQPILRDLLTQLQIANDKASPVSAVAEMDFGTVVAAVFRYAPVRDLVAPSPWDIRLNHWRNMAQHHKTKVDGSVIRGVYGTGKHAKQVSFSRLELFTVLTDIHLNWAVARGARIMFLFDNFEEARPFFRSTQVRDDSTLFQLHCNLAAQGFVLVNVTTSGQDTHAVVQDITDEETRSRLAHCSQFVLPVYLYFPNDWVAVDYLDKQGVPVMRFRAGRQDLDKVKEGNEPFEYLAEKVAFESLKKDA
jgi:hypothetical protein